MTSSEGTTTESSTTEGTSTGDNVAPVAVDDTYFATQDVELHVDVADALVSNDDDVDGDTLAISAFDATTIAGGTVDVAEDGSFAYVPAPGFWGTDGFGYTVEDGSGASSSATVTLFVAPAQIPLADVAAGAGGFAVDGEPFFGVAAGASVSGAGDVNGDGLDDLVIGAPYSHPNGVSSGRGYVVFGKSDATPVELSMLGDPGFSIDGEAAFDNAARSVSGAGDVNGDGLDDLIVGAPLADFNGSAAGRSYVLFGKADSDAISLSMLGAGGFVIDGEVSLDGAGRSVSGAGDVNGDGLDDLIVGAPGADPNGSLSGRSYVVFGKASSDPVQLAALGVGGFVIDGETADDQSGFSVSGAGDVDGDGLDDLIIGAPYADPDGVPSGRSYVVFGKADAAAVSLSMLGAGGFVLDGEAADEGSGVSVSGAGDVNGDGLADVIIGARPAGFTPGRSHLVFGKADTAAVQLSMLGVGGFALDGPDNDSALSAVSGAGDVNGDGMDDLIVGASNADHDGVSSGRSYVVYGKADTSTVDLPPFAASGFSLDGEAHADNAGAAVSGAGDVNGDGMSDLVVGARSADFAAEGAGRVYVVFGVPTADNCCSSHALGGCTDAVFEACVCALDNACCDSGWDDACVDNATNDCGACI